MKRKKLAGILLAVLLLCNATPAYGETGASQEEPALKAEPPYQVQQDEGKKDEPQAPQPQDPQPQHPEGFHQHDGDPNTYYGLAGDKDAINLKVTSIEDGKEYYYLTDETGAVRQEEGLYTYSWYKNGTKVVKYYFVTSGGKLAQRRLVTWNGNKYYIDKWGCALVKTRLWVNST